MMIEEEENEGLDSKTYRDKDSVEVRRLRSSIKKPASVFCGMGPAWVQPLLHQPTEKHRLR